MFQLKICFRCHCLIKKIIFSGIVKTIIAIFLDFVLWIIMTVNISCNFHSMLLLRFARECGYTINRVADVHCHYYLRTR